MPIDPEKLEQRIQQLGSEVFSAIKKASPSIFSGEFYTEKTLSLAMDDEEVKVALFRFVDVLPSLESSASIIKHAQEYFAPLRQRIPGLLQSALDIEPSAVTSAVIARVIRQQVRGIAKRFIVGDSAQSALKALRKIRKRGMAFTVDILGEATLSEEESAEYLQRYLELITTLSREVPQWAESAPLFPGHRGEGTPVNISVKLSALYSQAKAVSSEHSAGKLTEQLCYILAEAKKHNVFVYVDMEDCGLTSIILETFKRALESSEFVQFPAAGIVLQAYLRRTEEDVNEIIAWAKRRSSPIAVRLVKGAYWDTETILARQHGWEIPVWQKKENSDAQYEKLSRILLENASVVTPAFASHNVRSLCHAAAAAEALGVKKTEFEFQALFGMADPIKEVFVEKEILVREYSPVGELIPGMGYLVRRLLENTSNEGFLRHTFHEETAVADLLKTPRYDSKDTGAARAFNPRQTFSNIPLLDFTIPEVRARVREALRNREKQVDVPALVPPILSGKPVECSKTIKSTSPQNPTVVVAMIGLATVETCEKSLQLLSQFQQTWKTTSVGERAEVLFRAAELMEKQRYELIAIIIDETGKPWAEADGDVAEAIDFLNYYAHEAITLFQGKPLGTFAGEVNRYFYEPRGISVVIGPWNFPLAIPCGMFAAALVTGNCAILKPAEQSSFIASKLFEIFLAAGLPVDAAAFLPGLGEEIGPVLSKHPAVTTIVFTGSKAVGLSLIHDAASTSPSAQHIKRVIAEMGGKNAIIVDEDADLDEAVRGVVYSAFGFQGQKCSACSRVYVVGKIAKRFCQRLSEATKSIYLGPSSDPATFVGPVIDFESYTRLGKAIIDAKTHCAEVVEGGVPLCDLSQGYFVRPTVCYGVPKESPLLSDELFGPVLAVVEVKTFHEALTAALNSEYALTGAVYSRSPVNIERAIRDFTVGNLYINRHCTGALVCRQPFGGARMSGVGSKAGGPDYLLQFVIPRSISENTLRRGFAPAENPS